ncbi:hypothetical protein [Sphingomonas sp. 22R3R2A-7]|uniref:hypothetical protein n=1 Tax=Sphingomonas sp. 22R3R2A-7 TaxID=3050230 RepID=UPI002FE3BCFC
MPTPDPGFLRLIEEANEARRFRRLALDPAINHRVQAAAALEKALVGPLPDVVDLGEYMTRIVTLYQICDGAIGGCNTAIATEGLPGSWISPFGMALIDMMHFVTAGVSDDEQVTLRLSIARDRGRLAAALNVRGAFSALAAASATRGLLRACAMIDGLGGHVERFVNVDRMSIEMTFDKSGGRRFLDQRTGGGRS